MQKPMSTPSSIKENIKIARNTSTTSASTTNKNVCIANANVVEVIGAVQNKSSTTARTTSPTITVATLTTKPKNSGKTQRQLLKSDEKRRKMISILYGFFACVLIILAGVGVTHLKSIFSQPYAVSVHIPISNELLATISPSPDSFFDPTSIQSKAVTWAFSSVPNSISTATSLQRYILSILYYSLNGSSWKERRGWLSFDNECKWHGITCNNKNEVTMIWLQNNNLSGKLPHELAYLHTLDSLVIHENRVSGTIPSIYFDVLINLRQISFYDNRMTGTIPEDINKMDRLEYIGLQNNMFHGTIFHKIGSLKRLRTLYLHGNRLTGTLPSDVETAFSLEELAIENNSITGTLPSKLGALTNLRWISVQNNKLTGQIPVSIDKLTKIQTMYFYNNNFEGTAPYEVCEANKLRDYFTDCSGTFPQVVCHCCTACCGAAGCFKEEAERMRNAWLKRKKMGKVLLDL